MEHVEMGRPDGTCSSGAEDGLLRKTERGEEKGDIWGEGLAGGRGRRQREGGELEKGAGSLVGLAGRESTCRYAPHVLHLPLFSYVS